MKALLDESRSQVLASSPKSVLDPRIGDTVSEDDRTRFAEVVLPHLQDAFAMARWLAGNVHDAEDIVQEASLRALRGISGFRGDNARAWLMMIVRNTAYTWLRKNRDRTIVNVEILEAIAEDASLEAADHATPELVLIERSDAARLEAAIESLPPLFRETLVLRELHGFDYRAIAEITSVPIGTVMSRLARARRQLITVLGKADQ